MSFDLEAFDQKLRDCVNRMFSESRDTLTVRTVRQCVARECDIGENYTENPDWKTHAKQIIHDHFHKLLKAEEEEQQQQQHRGTKRPSRNDCETDENSSEVEKSTKKVKRATASKAVATKSKAQAKSAVKPSANSSAKTSKAPATKLSAKSKANSKSATHGDEDATDDTTDVTDATDGSPVTSSRRVRKSKLKSDEDSVSGVTKADNTASTANKETDDVGINHSVVDLGRDSKPKKDKVDEKSKAVRETGDNVKSPKSGSDECEIADADSKASRSKEAPKDPDADDYSDVIDEEPKPKRKPKSKKDANDKGKTKSTRKSASSKAAPQLSPDEQQIRKLQSQLTKCGIRKIWGIELKVFGDNSKRKISHLQQLLRDVGMDGRFSEAKAASIKQQRELAEDVEAIQEGDKSWGVVGGGRALRGTLKKSSVVNSANQDNEDAVGEGSKAKSCSEARGWEAEHAFLSTMLSLSEDST